MYYIRLSGELWKLQGSKTLRAGIQPTPPTQPTVDDIAGYSTLGRYFSYTNFHEWL
jgi:hypothetical protein